MGFLRGPLVRAHTKGPVTSLRQNRNLQPPRTGSQLNDPDRRVRAASGFMCVWMRNSVLRP